MPRSHLNIGKGMITMMSKIHSQTPPAQTDDKAEGQSEVTSDGAASELDLRRTKKALSKREIMEQLSRERFPWDE